MRAFPVQDTAWYQGMDLRDYFAAKAMVPIMADWYKEGDLVGDDNNADSIAGIAYAMADAMMEARKL